VSRSLSRPPIGRLSALLGRDCGAGASPVAALPPTSPQNAPRLDWGTVAGGTHATAPTTAVKANGQNYGRPRAAAATVTTVALTADRPSERSERDAVAAASGCGRAVAGAVAPAVLGKNTSNVSPSLNSRSNRWRIRASLRSIQPVKQARLAKCGHCRIAHDVGIGMAGGRARFQGLMRCGSVWACPVCAATIRTERAAEVSAIYKWAKEAGGSVLMLTLTVRHELGDDLEAVRRGVADAWRRAQGGKKWTLLRQQYGITGYVRALEVTHGANGWHPHLHILMILDKPITEEGTARLRSLLSVRWQNAVSRALGADFVPNDHIGTNLKPAHIADYITKLGLELSDIGSKSAGKSNRTPWQIASDYADYKRPEDAVIWQRFVEGMKGARMLTYSRGLRAAAGLLDEPTDEELVEAEEMAACETIFLMDATTWAAVRKAQPWLLLSAAEHSGVDGIQRAITDMLRAPP